MTPDEWENVVGPWVYKPVQGGWMLADAAHGERFAVRFAPDDQGRLEPVELRLDSGTPIDTSLLRRLPLAHMRVFANAVIDYREQLANQQGPMNVPTSGRATDPLDRTAYPQAMQPGHPHPKQNVRKRLKVPAGAKGDGFYRQIASVYSALAAASNRPAVELAAANNVPVTTAHRWVKEARRRGFLPPGQKGRRG